MKAFLDNLESVLCRILLATFVTLLFAQIVSRQVFGYSIAWSEELSTYMFVWFAYFGASHAARLSVHNRVTVQFQILPRRVVLLLETIADALWVCFNVYFVYLCYVFIFQKMNLFWKSQTLGIPMKYIYMILPVAFALMAIRVVQVMRARLAEAAAADTAVPAASLGGHVRASTHAD